jgi:hypothetical protein
MLINFLMCSAAVIEYQTISFFALQMTNNALSSFSGDYIILTDFTCKNFEVSGNALSGDIKDFTANQNFVPLSKMLDLFQKNSKSNAVNREANNKLRPPRYRSYFN